MLLRFMFTLTVYSSLTINPPSQKARERGAVIVKEPPTLEDKDGKVRLAVLQTVREDH